MNRNRALFIGFAFVLISIGFSAFYYGHVPPLMPTHWDASGHVDGYMPKLWGVLIWPMIIAGLWLLLLISPIISPKGFRIDQFIGTYNLIVVAVLAFTLFASVVALMAAAGSSFHIQSLVTGAVGLLLVVIGNYMGKLRKNFFIGIRTPWTLASDDVWAKTHRLGGWMFIFGGLGLITQSLTGVNEIALLGIIAIIVVVPIGYSFFEYKRLEGLGPNGDIT
jgi:uncharacterized membrane protein